MTAIHYVIIAMGIKHVIKLNSQNSNYKIMKNLLTCQEFSLVLVTIIGIDKACRE